MRFIDNLNQSPQDAFGSALIMLIPALHWLSEVLGEHTDDHRVRVIPVIAATLFLSGAVGLFLRGCQMQRTAKQHGQTSTKAEPPTA